MHKLQPQQEYRLVTSGIFKNDFYKIHLRSILKINNDPFIFRKFDKICQLNMDGDFSKL